MSDYEAHRGRIIKVDPKETLEETLMSILSEEAKEHYKKWTPCIQDDKVLEYIGDELWEEVIVIDGTLYKIIDEELDPSDSYINVEHVGLGEFRYDCRFYNGGTCLSEMIEYGIKNTLKSM